MSFDLMHEDTRKTVYRLDYNAKNAFGGYVGRKSYVCRLPKLPEILLKSKQARQAGKAHRRH